VHADIVLSYKTVREAEAVVRAVSPDNVTVPVGLSVKTERRGNRVVTRVVCETRLETFTATLDDFLSAVSVAERALSAVGNR